MKNTFKSVALLLVVGVSTLVSSCKKDEVDVINPGDKNNLTLEFENRVGGQILALGTTTYKNASGEDFTVTTFNYFVSNISLKKDNGEVVKFPDQYFLVKAANASSLMPTLKDVPAGNYKEITYTIGVDSTKSVSPVEQRTGVLDPASYGDDSMYWSWNSGYIFVKIEGTSSVAPKNSAGLNKYQFHIGGFGGRTSATVNNLRTVTLPLADAATVRSNIAPTIHLVTDVAKIFDNAKNIKIAATPVVMNPAASGDIVNNYKTMYNVEHVHNDKQ